MKLNLSEIPHKFRHFYWNKHVLKLFRKERFFMSYSYRYKAIWFRNYMVAYRTINNYTVEVMDVRGAVLSRMTVEGNTIFVDLNVSAGMNLVA